MNVPKERVFVVIDGSNFYHRLVGPEVGLRNLLSFDFLGFADLLAKGRVAVKKSYYTGVVRATPDDRFHEKGVDVKIAVDILSGAYEDLYDMVLLASSDTDLVPAVQKARLLGKKIEYIGFSHRPSFAMQRHCGFTRLLSRDDLAPFIPQQ